MPPKWMARTIPHSTPVGSASGIAQDSHLTSPERPTRRPVIHSTPMHRTTGTIQADSHVNPVTVEQKIMKQRMKSEIGDQVWQFDARKIAQMLSRKTRKATLEPLKEGEIDKLSNYNFAIDDAEHRAAGQVAFEKFFDRAKKIAWPTGGSEEKFYYPPVTDLLNECIQSLQTTLADNSTRLYGKMKFVAYPEKPVQDCVKGSPAPLRPDIVGISHDATCPPTWWNPTNETDAQAHIPVEVKSNFNDMINQAGTYGRCLFSASTFRQFALVLAFDHKREELTFLIFHRGGETRSVPLPIKGKRNLSLIHHVFLSIMTWKSQEDAGIPTIFNGTDVFLPLEKDDKTGSPFRVVETISSKICIRGRANHVYRVCGDDTVVTRKDPLFNATNIPPPNFKESQVPQPAPATDPRVDNGGSSSQTCAKRKVGDSSFAQDDKPPPRRSPRIAESKDKAETATGADSNSEPLVPTATLRLNHGEYVPPRVYRSGTKSRLSTEGYLVVKYSCNEDKNGSSRCIEAEVLEKCAGMFGTARHHCSFQVCTRDGNPMSNHIFVPSPDDTEEDIAKAYAGDGLIVPNVERRSPWVHVSDFAGKSLVMAESPRELFIAIFHAMLGWLGMLVRLYLHRDISIGNILITDEAVLLDEFDLHYEEEDWESTYKQFGLTDEPTSEDVKGKVKELEDIIKQLGVSKECHGFVVDGDMVANLRTNWDNHDHGGQRSGTYEFMSVGLVQSMEQGNPYFQSPVDDLFSFYYVCQWATLFHQPVPNLPELKSLLLLAESLSQRTFMTYQHIVSPLVRKKVDYGSFFKTSRPLLRQWHQELIQLESRWATLHEEASELDLDRDQQQKFYIRNFIAFAREGVVQLGKALVENWQGLSSATN